MSAPFSLTPVEIPLPRGAFPGGGRAALRFGDRPICAFTRGRFRPCLHPVWTPAGHVVTAEQPADHPHHGGIWIAADHIGLLLQGPDGTERYDYCFYVDQVFQGRMPGQIRESSLCLLTHTDHAALVRQDLDWVGPAEWGAEAGRAVVSERRWTAVTVSEAGHIFDITSEVTPAGDTPVALGPTRHAWFNARVADAIALDTASRVTASGGTLGASAIQTRDTDWVDYSGPVGGGAMAGITVAPVEPRQSAWFVADWGIMTVGQIRDEAIVLQPGERARFACRMLAHDGPLSAGRDIWARVSFVAPDDMTSTTTGGTE